MRSPVYLFAAAISVLSACAAPVSQFHGRQCNLPAAITCVDDDAVRHSRCETLVISAVAEINHAAGHEILVYARVPGAIPVAFVHDLSAKVGVTKGRRVMGVTIPQVAKGGCIYAAIIGLDDSLLEGWDAPWAGTVTTHEILHAIGMEHGTAGIMTPGITDPTHTQHMSPDEVRMLREHYRNR